MKYQIARYILEMLSEVHCIFEIRPCSYLAHLDAALTSLILHPFEVSLIIFSKRHDGLLLAVSAKSEMKVVLRNFHENASVIVMKTFDDLVKPLPKDAARLINYPQG